MRSNSRIQNIRSNARSNTRGNTKGNMGGSTRERRKWRRITHAPWQTTHEWPGLGLALVHSVWGVKEGGVVKGLVRRTCVEGRTHNLRQGMIARGQQGIIARGYLPW